MDADIVQFDVENASSISYIRKQVFVKEQRIDLEIDFDGLDEFATHVLVSIGVKYVGTGRILSDGHIGRIAVLKSFRRKGVGAKIVESLIVEAKEKNYKRVYLGSQMHAIEFYKSLGFNTCGSIFMDAGLEHIEMEMLLV